MLEESLPAIVASVYGWFTPTVLFVLLNLVIGTIAVTSKASSSSSGGDHSNASAPPPSEGGSLYRTSSLVLDRLRSFNLNRYRSGDIPHPLESVPAPGSQILEPVPASPSPPAAEEHYEEDHNLERSQSDAHPTAGEMPAKLPARMKKSASERSAFAHFEEAEIVETPPPRPATTKARPAAAVETSGPSGGGGGGDEVDARADDFINRFRQQLKLQRLDSIMRYKEMLQRGAAAGN